MRLLSIGIAAAVLVSAATQIAADCAAEVRGLTDEIETLEAERDVAGEVSTRTADASGGEMALTGDPLDPNPAEPATPEVPTATPTGEEAEGVMPGADASVELVAEDLAQVALLRDQARAAAEAGDEAACRQALEEARALLDRLQG